MGDENTWAIVTGASSGLGAEFAALLAKRKINLVLTARSEPQLQQLAQSVRRKHTVEVVIEPLDLSVEGSAAVLQERLDARGIEPEIVINNAGCSLYELFVDHDPERLRGMLQLDIISLVELSHLYGRRMASKGQGRILLVGSMAAYQPVALMAAYAGAKAFVLSFGEALHGELAPKVSVTVLSPGLMDTGFNAASGYESPKGLEIMKLPPATVAQIGLDALFAGKSGVIAGRLNKVMAFSSRLMPRHFSAKAAMPRTAPARG